MPLSQNPLTFPRIYIRLIGVRHRTCISLVHQIRTSPSLNPLTFPHVYLRLIGVGHNRGSCGDILSFSPELSLGWLMSWRPWHFSRLTSSISSSRHGSGEEPDTMVAGDWSLPLIIIIMIYF